MEAADSDLKALLLQMIGEHDLDLLLHRITDGLGARKGVALVRIWLLAPGDLCDTCPQREVCRQHVPCLHLVASAGNPLGNGLDWGRVDGRFRRFPIGVRKIGRVGTGETLCVEDIESDSTWIADPEWARSEGVRGFGGVPLEHAGQVLGVLGLFTRMPFDPATLGWLRILADHAAVTIVNARAFEEIARLRNELEIENEYLREEVNEAKAFGQIVGESESLRLVQERIELVAPTDAAVLIQGESGTGKELVAREIHARSGRAERPLIQVNCAAIPRELYESEFFGHVRGAFTGAGRDRAGRFAAADGGTLFLDEVGEIPLELQGKLLRVLQEGTYERVGEERTRKVDTRIVAATNRDLRGEVEARRFREDLYYRLDVFPITVAPLRERRADIGPLARHFLERAVRRLGGRTPRLTQACEQVLTRYDWPGNVRELQNVVERAVIVARGGPLRFELENAGARGGGGSRRAGASTTDEDDIMTDAELQDLEKSNLRTALRRTRWKIAGEGGAAALLGVKPTTLRSRIRKLGIERPV